MKLELVKVVCYSLVCWKVLMCYVDDGCIEIDNLVVECVLCGVVFGCGNYLFMGLNVGGECVVLMYSLIEIVKFNGFDFEVYLCDVLQCIVDYLVNWIDELLFWNIVSQCVDEEVCVVV